jgi:outer membrane receptor protein involved in Fe transport
MLAAPAVFSALAAHAAGQQEPGATTPVQQVEIRGTAGSYDARRDDTAAKIVISKEDIGRYGDTTIGEVLKRVPGVTISGVPGRGGEIRMRGLGNGYTQVLLDGQPVPQGFSLDSIAPSAIARIEVMRAATAESGAQSIAGTINIMLRKITAATAKREIMAGIQQENGEPGANADFQLSDSTGALAWSLGGAAAKNRNAWPFGFITEGSDPAGAPVLLRRTEVRSKGQFESVNLAPRLSWTLAPDDVLALGGFFDANRLSGDDLVRINTVRGDPPRYSSAGIRIESNFQLARSDLTWTRKLRDGASLEAKAGASYGDRDSRTSSLEYDAATLPLLSRIIAIGATDKGVTLSAEYATPIAEAHALKAGWDGAYNKRAEVRSQRERSDVQGLARDLDQSFDADVARLSLFAQDDWTIDPRLALYFGVHWESIQARSSSASYALRSRSSVWSPSLQALWKLPGAAADQLRLALARTYKAPEMSKLVASRVVAENNSATTPDFSGNPALRPELAWGLDLAYEHNLAGGGLLSASAFLRRIDDVVLQRVGLIDGVWLSTPVNAGVANTRGMELEAKLPFRSLYKSAPNVDFRANLARNWSTLNAVPGPNNRLDQQTPFSGTIGADYKLDGMPLTLGGSYSFQNGGPVRISEHQHAYTAPKRSLDVYGLWKFTPRNQLRVSLANALHQENVAQSSYVDAIGRLSDTTITPTSVVLRALLEMKL